MHAQSGNGGINLNQILHTDFLGGRSDIYETASKLVQGFESGRPAEVKNFAYPVDFWTTDGKRFALCYGTVVLSCPVCDVGVLWPNG